MKYNKVHPLTSCDTTVHTEANIRALQDLLIQTAGHCSCDEGTMATAARFVWNYTFHIFLLSTTFAVSCRNTVGVT